jgi:hypothetical protein
MSKDTHEEDATQPMGAEEEKVTEAIADFVGQPDKLDMAVAELMAQAVDEVLKELGVSPGEVDDTQRQMEEREIRITSMESAQAPQLNGYYIYQRFMPVAFVSWPYLGREGKLIVQITRFTRQDAIAEAEGAKLITL